MNIAVHPGKSYRPLSVVCYGPDISAFRANDFHRGYRRGTLDVLKIGRKRFREMCWQGHLLNCVVQEGGDPVAVFGLTMHMDEAHGAHLNFLYFVGRGDDRVYSRITSFCFDAAQIFAWEHGQQRDIWFRLKGRPGWRKVLERLGVKIEGDWISAEQGVFRHGRSDKQHIVQV